MEHVCTSAPGAGTYFADRACYREVVLVENRPLARDTWRLRWECPEIAQTVVPGQFLMLRLAGWSDPLIGRPLAMFRTVGGSPGNRTGVELVYLVKGKLTRRLADCGAETRLQVWGPLGNGFSPAPCDTLIMVAGGIGQTPFPALAAEALGHESYGNPRRPSGWARRVILCYGVRSADYLAGVEVFDSLGVDVRVATEDGSRGHHGLVTAVLEQCLQECDGNHRIVCCGPEPMMAAVSRVAERTGTPCEVSLETPMACGIGICFTCVARIRDAGGNWDYQRTCVQGPVFDARQIVW